MAATSLSPLCSPPLDSPQTSFLFKSKHYHSPSKPLLLSSTPSFPCSPTLPLPQKFRLSSSFPQFSPTHSSCSPSDSNPCPHDSTPAGYFLTPDDVSKNEILSNFNSFCHLDHGVLIVRPMAAEDIALTVRLLAESFAESLLVPSRFTALLEFLVKQYVMERRVVMPHAVTLVGFFRGEDGSEELAGTVEVSFDAKGANASPPTPLPPKDCPYICNMAVKKSLRRRHIGWNLLKASEELVSQMTTSRTVYLHCRMVDKAPLKMYTKAGYSIDKTDSILTLFTFQRRKYLMYKKLPDSNALALYISGPDD